VKQNHEAGSHTGLWGTKLFPRLQPNSRILHYRQNAGEIAIRILASEFCLFAQND